MGRFLGNRLVNASCSIIRSGFQRHSTPLGKYAVVSGSWKATLKGVAETCDNELECASFHVETDMQYVIEEEKRRYQDHLSANLQEFDYDGLYEARAPRRRSKPTNSSRHWEAFLHSGTVMSYSSTSRITAESLKFVPQSRIR